MMKFTYTSLFVFPLLGIPKNLFSISKYSKGKYIGTRFVNAYLHHEGIDTPINSICVVYSNFMDKDQAAFQDTLEAYDNFRFTYDLLKGYMCVSVFSIPEDQLEAYNLFLEGQYSKYPNRSKSLCYDYVPGDIDIMVPFLQSIFLRESPRREKLERDLKVTLSDDAELWSIYDPEKESINPFNIKKLKSKIIEYAELWPRQVRPHEFLDEINVPEMGKSSTEFIE